MALARVKTYWAEMEATAIATQSSAVGRVSAEHYFEEVLEGMYSHCNRGSVLEECHVRVTCIPIVKTMLFEL